MHKIWRSLPTATTALASLRGGELSVADLLRQCALRTQRFQLAAWASYTGEHVDAHALCCQKSLSSALRGIPIGVKDIIDVTGYPTRGGSLATDAAPKSRTAPVVEPLLLRGAAVVGKTVTCQFACFDPALTLNPWKLDRTPGGSSAGSAAAVAAGHCLIALGTQTGGSIIRPASYCGICGFKPAHDPQWLEGVMPVSGRLDHVGPLARCVADLELAWSAITGRDVPEPEVNAPTLGVLRDYFWQHAVADVRSVTDRAIERLQARGATIVAVPLPPAWRSVHAHHRTIMAFDCARAHAAQFERAPQHFLPQISGLIRAGLEITPAQYAVAVQAQVMFREQLSGCYGGIDALLMPATPTTAPPRDTTGDPRFNSPWSFAGVPAVCFPAGLAGDGLPCGLQLVRPHGWTHADEFALLAVARWCEAVLAVDLWPEQNRRLEEHFPETQWVDGP